MKKEKQVDQLKHGECFHFPSLKNIPFVFIQFRWREDVLVFRPYDTNMVFETEMSYNDILLTD